MKRLLFSIFSIIATIALSLNVGAAEDFAYTVNWDTPGAISITLADITGNPMAIDPASTSYVATQTGYIYLRPTKGFIIKSVTDRDGKAYKISGYRNYGGQYVSLSCYGSQNGNVFNVVTEKLEKTGEFELDIINGEYALDLYLNNGTDRELSTFAAPELIKGTQKVDLTAYDNELMVVKDDGKPVYSIKKNGQPIPVESFSGVPVESGDKIEIQAYEVEPERVSVSIAFVEGAEGCLNSVYDATSTKLIPYSAIEAAGNTVNCNAGTTLRFNFHEDYLLNSITVNGTPAELPAEDMPFKVVIEENTTILVDAAPKVYEEIEGVVYVEGPVEGLRFTTGIMDYDVEIPISGGEELTEDVVFTYSNGKTFTVKAGTAKKYTLMMPGKTHKFFYDALPGYWIVDRILGNPDDPDYPVASLAVLAENAPLFVKVATIGNDTKAVVFYDGEDEAARFYAQNVRFPGRLEIDGIPGSYLTNGYSIIEFDSGYHESFSVGKAGGSNSNEILAYLDGKKLKYNEDSMAYTGFKMNEGSVLKVFSVPSGTTPALHSVKFEIEAGVAVEVLYDVMKVHNPDSDLECIGKTLVSVIPSGSADVSLDGNALEADAEGRYEFVTSRSGHVLRVGTQSGVSQIESDELGEPDIFNLQGIKLSGSVKALPAGIYIVNGRKVIKK
ncbi:MAG: lipocalin/fatty acid-binding family protein [Muribaculaceae bacterium]|nr:lipocalin/fatty acid-binding family protein [Muribaculaceae bacterium]